MGAPKKQIPTGDLPFRDAPSLGREVLGLDQIDQEDEVFLKTQIFFRKIFPVDAFLKGFHPIDPA
jgi:hypothetical protein